MGKRKIYREGERFGKLIAIKYIPDKKYLCKCDCGNEKIIRTCSLIQGYTQSCGCIYSIERESYDEDMKKKLLSSIEISDNGCWIWIKSKHKQGYGNFPYKSKVYLAHRISWTLFKGQIPNGLLVCHNCPKGDNPSCCNPDHLFLGNDKINSLDALSKGRLKSFNGEKHYFTKLQNKDIFEIRRLASLGILQQEIAEKFNISKSNVSKIVLKKTWKHV